MRKVIIWITVIALILSILIPAISILFTPELAPDATVTGV